MKFKATVWERVFLTLHAANVSGRAGRVRTAIKVMDAVELSTTEKKEVGYRQGPQGPQWDDTGNLIVEVEIGDREAAALMRQLVEDVAREREKQGEWSVAFLRNFEVLAGKLGINLEEIEKEIEIEKDQKMEENDEEKDV